MRRSIPVESDEAVLARMFWVVPPQAGRLVPLALCIAERDNDATLYSVASGGLSQRQIDDTPLAAAVNPAFFHFAFWPTNGTSKGFAP